jgi:hypothetical protein
MVVEGDDHGEAHAPCVTKRRKTTVYLFDGKDGPKRGRECWPAGKRNWARERRKRAFGVDCAAGERERVGPERKRPGLEVRVFLKKRRRRVLLYKPYEREIK